MANTDANVKDAAVIAETTEDDYDVLYKKYFENAERAKTEYEHLYKEMVENLSTTHLEPFATVLVEQEKRKLVGQEEIIRVLKQNLLSKLQEYFNQSWESCDISNRLATLAFLKERYKEYEGHNWHIQDMPPKQRLLPLRMRCKESSRRYLEKQIQNQNIQLEELIKINAVQRAHVQEVTNQRVYLKEAMEREAKQLAEKKQKLQQLQDEMLEESGDE